jgi:hypothetical protein
MSNIFKNDRLDCNVDDTKLILKNYTNSLVYYTNNNISEQEIITTHKQIMGFIMKYKDYVDVSVIIHLFYFLLKI